MLRPLLYLLLWLAAIPLWGQSTPSNDVRLAEDEIITLNINPRTPQFLKGKYDLTDYLYVLADSVATRSFLEVSSPENTKSFRPLSEVSTKDLSVLQHGYWLRLSVQSELPEGKTWLSNINEANVTAFSEKAPGLVLKRQCGFLVPRQERHYRDQYGMVGALPFEIPANARKTYYWRVKPAAVNGITSSDQNLNFILIAPGRLSNYLIFEGIILALFLGFFIAMRNMLVLFYFYYRSKSYLLFSIYCFTGGVALFVVFGYDLHFFLPGLSNELYYFIRILVYIIWAASMLAFSRILLEIPRFIPRVDKALWIIFALGVACLFAGNFIQWTEPLLGFRLLRAGQTMVFVIAIILLVIALLRFRQGMESVKYFLWGHLILLVGFGLTLSNFFRWLPAIDHVHWIALGFWVNSRILAYGLGLIIPKHMQERKLAREEAITQKKLNTLKTNLYTNISHEFRTPLTVILGIVQNISGHEKERNLINRNGNKLLLLTNQLLDMSKMDSGNVQPAFEQFDITVYLSYLVESFYSAAAEKDIKLTFYAEEDEIIMDFDEKMVQQIVYNLLSNALKFTEKGGKIILHAKKFEAGGGAVLQLKCKDTGIGIPTENLPFIFDRFYQVDSFHVRKGEGTGIGLSLTKQYVELLGGEISVKSEIGKGTELLVVLPIHQNAPLTLAPDLQKERANNLSPGLDITESAPLQEAESGQFDLSLESKPLLLIVEDNKDVAIYIESIVREDYHIITVENGMLGLEKAIELVPDIIISDIMMPEMDGLTLTKRLKEDERTSHIPIIILTAKAKPDDRISGLEVGADAYLIKPFNKDELLIRLDKLIRLKTAIREYYSNLNPLYFSQTAVSNPEKSFLLKVGKVVEKHLSNADFSVMHFCREVNLSQPQLYRKLKALTGKSPALFIRSVRLHKALDLLKTSDLNVSEIAWEVGFNDPGYFSRAFKEEFAQSPSEFRN